MSYNLNDIVRIGKGKVEYTITNANPEEYGHVLIESNNTGKSQLIETARLTLVTAAPVEKHASENAINAGEVHMSTDWVKAAFTEVQPNGLTDAQMEEAEDTYTESGIHAANDYVEQAKEENKREQPMAAWEIELVSEFDLDRPYLLTVDHVTTGYKSYTAACDALVIAKREGFKHYAVIDHYGKRKATRIAA